MQINIKLTLLILTALLFFTGCEEKIYSQFCTTKKLHVNCFKIKSIDSELDHFLKEQDLHVDIDETCPFSLVGMHYHVKACKNPVANSVGADFDGYVKLQIFYKGNCYYRVQQDFKSAPWQEQMLHILKQLKKDLNL